ncbi:hypothetical protein [Streptomyces roseolus]|uniref:hypothetical protein n=1 Tax=Streptomyces roseolus TaxID=67358 RepID=UPI001676E9A2|nr:hypothetical protein [Streptomyces roseolus]GGR51758.1 hypothetical protein GCM10010282_50860 [Streptomyces roseolus]
MTDIPYGVGGCRCAVDSDNGNARWARNPSCPYHGIVADGFGANRTDTGMYRVVGAWDALGEPVDPDSLDNRLRQGIEQAQRGETADRGDFSQYLDDTHYPVWRDVGWFTDGDDDGGEVQVCGTCVPKHSHYPSREDVPEWPCSLAVCPDCCDTLGDNHNCRGVLPVGRRQYVRWCPGCLYGDGNTVGGVVVQHSYDDRCGEDDPQNPEFREAFEESPAELRRGQVKPARTFKEEPWWTRLRIRLRWAKEALFDDVG